jgi:iron complex transport system permease protein
VTPTIRLTGGRLLRVLALLAAALGATLVLAAAVGGVPIDWRRALDFSSPDNPDSVILFRTRLPRVLLGATVGGGLAAAGAALQALLRNALASPDVVGISGGASVGAIVVLALGADAGGWLIVPAAAFLGSLAAMGLIVGLSTVRGRLNPYSLLLVGVIVNTVSAALIMLVSTMVDTVRAQGVLLWLTGSLAERSYALVGAITVYMVAGTLVLWTQARSLNVLSLGEETAVSLGADIRFIRRTTFLASALLVGAAVSVSGVIGFVGLIVPHCLRLVVGPDQRALVPASFLGGAVFLVIADTVGRSLLAPTEIPVGAITALCGGPFFIFLLRRQQAGTAL